MIIICSILLYALLCSYCIWWLSWLLPLNHSYETCIWVGRKNIGCHICGFLLYTVTYSTEGTAERYHQRHASCLHTYKIITRDESLFCQNFSSRNLKLIAWIHIIFRRCCYDLIFLNDECEAVNMFLWWLEWFEMIVALTSNYLHLHIIMFHTTVCENSIIGFYNDLVTGWKNCQQHLETCTFQVHVFLMRYKKWIYTALKNRISFWVWVLYTWNAYRMLDIYSDMQRYGSHDILQSFLKAKQMKV